MCSPLIIVLFLIAACECVSSRRSRGRRDAADSSSICVSLKNRQIVALDRHYRSAAGVAGSRLQCCCVLGRRGGREFESSAR